MRLKTIALCVLLTITSKTYAQINLYGPGGPHVPLLEAAQKYKELTGVDVIVNYGPQGTWNERASQNADILFGASEQSALAIATDHAEKFDIKNITPLYLRRAIILVRKGNPKGITGLRYLADKSVGIIAPDGAGRSNTSGTGVWEDMVGRTQDIKLMQKFRNNIVSFTPNSGTARKMFLEDPNVDAWITWIDWAKSNPDYGDVVEIEKDLVVYRDVNVVARKDASTETLKFIDFLKSETVKRIFEKYGFVE